MNQKKIFKAAIYARISKGDGSIGESGSISNQKALIHAFAERQTDIEIVSERIDDGYTGSNFDRPQYTLMEEDAKNGRINCIIVKDLSRFGRNFIESGKKICYLVYQLNVRFIVINDNIDSIDPKSGLDSILLPIKNLINDFYLADLSVKIRSQFEVRRKKGEFLSAFVTYGYKKSPENKKKIIIDETVSSVVQLIYSLKLDGWSASSIANHLNDHNVPSPLEYKQANGENFSTAFQVNKKCLWSATSIFRILKNKIYIGTLEQGKSSTPNYKIKERTPQPESQWVVIPNNHEAIIDKEIFEIIQVILSRDTRKSPEQLVQHPLSGTVFCGDCHASLLRRNNKTAYNPHFTYVCSTYKSGKGCSKHSISVEELEHTVLTTVNSYIDSVAHLEKLLQMASENLSTTKQVEKHNTTLQEKETEKKKFLKKIEKTNENFQNGELSKEDYHNFLNHYESSVSTINKQIDKIKSDIEMFVEGNTEAQRWMKLFIDQQNAPQLTRKLVATLINRIDIYEDKRIKIIFNFNAEFETALSYTNSFEKFTSQAKEVS